MTEIASVVPSVLNYVDYLNPDGISDLNPRGISESNGCLPECEKFRRSYSLSNLVHQCITHLKPNKAGRSEVDRIRLTTNSS